MRWGVHVVRTREEVVKGRINSDGKLSLAAIRWDGCVSRVRVQLIRQVTLSLIFAALYPLIPYLSSQTLGVRCATR